MLMADEGYDTQKSPSIAIPIPIVFPNIVVFRWLINQRMDVRNDVRHWQWRRDPNRSSVECANDRRGSGRGGGNGRGRGRGGGRGRWRSDDKKEQNKDRYICSHYLNNNCSYGYRCHHYHPLLHINDSSFIKEKNRYLKYGVVLIAPDSIS